MSLCSMIYNNKQGFSSVNDLIQIMNIGNQSFSSLFQLARQSYLMQTELPTMLSVLDTDYHQNDRVKATLVLQVKRLQQRNISTVFFTDSLCVQDFLPDCIYSGFYRLYSLRLQLSQTQYPEDYKDFEGFTSYKISIWLPIENNNIQHVPETPSVL